MPEAARGFVEPRERREGSLRHDFWRGRFTNLFNGLKKEDMGILISKMTEESIRRYGPNLSGFFKFMIICIKSLV